MENAKTGIFIRQLRKERGMTQKDLAAALGVTDKAVSKWELGTSLPDVALLLPLLAARRRPLAWALGALSAAILPYLYGLGRLLDDPRVFRLGLPIAPAAAVCLWTAWALCRRLRRRKLLAAGALLLLAMVLSLYVNAVAAALTGGAVHLGDCLPTLALAAACLLADFVLRRRRETA